MKRFLVLALFCSLNNIGLSQIDSINYDINIYNRIYKNIVSYNIYNASYSFNGINVQKALRHEQLNPFDGLIADYGYKLKINYEKLDWSYPMKEYVIYKVTVDGFIFSDSINNIEKRVNGPIINKYFLIGVESKKQNVLFISGQFFLHEIADDFNIEINKPSSLIGFLKFKTFQYQTKDIYFLKEDKNELWFKGYSNAIGKNLLIKVPKKRVDYLSVQAE